MKGRSRLFGGGVVVEANHMTTGFEYTQLLPREHAGISITFTQQKAPESPHRTEHRQMAGSAQSGSRPGALWPHPGASCPTIIIIGAKSAANCQHTWNFVRALSKCDVTRACSQYPSSLPPCRDLRFLDHEAPPMPDPYQTSSGGSSGSVGGGAIRVKMS